MDGSQRTDEAADRIFGEERVSIVTNQLWELIRRRFERDGLQAWFGRVLNPYEGKASTLYDLAMREPSTSFTYVGDLVSDGEACLEARERGASNMRFVAVTHPQSLSHEDFLNSFAEAHAEFASAVPSLDALTMQWSS